MNKRNRKPRNEDMYRAILALQTEEECQKFFDDLCTVKEVENMAERCHAAKLLLQGDTYAQVMEKADISSATLSRVSRCVQYGNGYRNLLKAE